MNNHAVHTGPELLQRIIDGDIGAFDQLFTQMYAPLFMLTNRLTSDEESARDIVSEVFLQLWEKRTTLQHIKDVKAYLYVSARNKSLNYLRKIKINEKHELKISQQQTGELSADFLNTLFDTEMIRTLYHAIKELPPECKRVMDLSLEGLTTNEIATQLNISASAVSHQKSRALRLLREKIPPDLFLACLFLVF